MLLILQTLIFAASAQTLGVVNKTDGTALLVDVRTRAAQTVVVGRLPHEIFMTKDHAFVTNYGSNHIRSSDIQDNPGNSLAVISLTPPHTVKNIDLGVARCAPHGVTASKDGQRVYVTCEGRHEIAVVDVAQGKVTHTLPTNQAGSHMLEISPDESRAYVANFWLGTVSVIDLKNRVLMKQIRTGRGSEGIGLSPDGLTLLVSRVEDNEIVKIDTTTMEVVLRKQLSAGSSPIRVIVNPADPQQVLVNNVGAGTMQVLNLSDLSLIKEIKVGRQPIGLTAGANQAFAANMKDNTVSVINLKTFQVESEIPTGRAPDGIHMAH